MKLNQGHVAILLHGCGAGLLAFGAVFAEDPVVARFDAFGCGLCLGGAYLQFILMRMLRVIDLCRDAMDQLLAVNQALIMHVKKEIAGDDDARTAHLN